MNLSILVSEQRVSDVFRQNIDWPEQFLVDVNVSYKRAAIYTLEEALEPRKLEAYSPCQASIGGPSHTYAKSSVSTAILTRIGQLEKSHPRIVIYGHRDHSEFALYEHLADAKPLTEEDIKVETIAQFLEDLNQK